jgi:hypothetical protein
MALQDKAILTYKASDMVLAVHSNASYLSEPKACSRVGGHMLWQGEMTYQQIRGLSSIFCK